MSDSATGTSRAPRVPAGNSPVPVGLTSVVGRINTTAAVTRDAVAKLASAAVDPAEFFSEIATRLRRVVPYDASGWMTLDPDTLLPSGALETQKPAELVRALWRNELQVPDAHKLTVLAARPAPVAALSQLSPAAAADSERLQVILSPRGIGDEMRVMLRAGGSTWGHFALYRESGSRVFDADELDRVADLAVQVGEGLRRSLSRRPAPEAVDALAPGVVAFDGVGSITSATSEASRLMSLMPGDATTMLYAVAAKASQSDGAKARIRLLDGQWLLAHGGRMHGAPADSAQVTVTLTPAPRSDVMSILLRLHGLSAREREVAELLMTATATDAIAERLYISPHTLHDHVKSIFAKLGAKSRAELMTLGSNHVPLS
jgi:DNA-binding CsgD family transcriptional regulator